MCTQALRAQEIQTIEGQQAYGLYRVWLERQRKAPPSIETFCASAYYASLLRFTRWARETGVPDLPRYVAVMVGSRVSPALWRRGEAYQLFLDHIDQQDPYGQAHVAVETLLTLAEGLGVPPGEVFSRFKAGELNELIRQRRLSPWLLLCSVRFKEWVDALGEPERAVVYAGIGPGWTERFKRLPDVVESLKETARELGI